MGGPHRLRRDMTEAELIEARRHARHVAYRRASGVPDTCTPEETARALAKLRRMAYRHAMSNAQIAEAAGISTTTVKDCISGFRSTPPHRPIKSLHRYVYTGIMNAPILPPDGRRRMPVVGAQRRLQAMSYQGFSLKMIAEFLGHANYQRAWVIQHRTKAFIYWDSLKKIIDVYDKHHAEDPTDYGQELGVVKRSITAARKQGWAPHWAWDDDTIDDPTASPEWTGACGTEEGYRIHVRETINGNPLPPCEPCKAVAEVVQPGRQGAVAEIPFEFNAERFGEALDRRGINPRQLSIKLGRDPKHADRFYRWRQGDRQPKNRSEVYAVAAALDLEPGDLMRDLEPGEGGAKRLIGQPGGFNPFFFRAVVDACGWTQYRVGDMCGVSQTTVAKWIRGEFSPATKDVLKPLAKELGLSVEVFYS